MSHVLGRLFLLILLAFTPVYFSQAWVEPSEGLNIFAPLNCGKSGQTKSGGLLLNSLGAKVGLTVEKGNVGIGTANPQSIFEVSSQESALILPRVTTVERDSIASPKFGMVVFNTDSKKINLYDGAIWKEVTGGSVITDSKTIFANSDAREGDYYCKKTTILDDGRQGDWSNINEGKNCGSGKWCKSGDCSLCGVDLYWDGSSLTCSSVGIGNYSPDNNNNRYPCTNKPANSTYTGSGGGINNCPWSCDSGYVNNNGVCIQPFVCGVSTVVDEENNVYNTVLIGSMCWTKENMKSGSIIGYTSSPSNNNKIEKFCPQEGSASSCDTYGGLYHWDEAMKYGQTQNNQGICPNGWHVPTDADWGTLETYLKNSGASCNVSRSGSWDCAGAGSKLMKGGSSGFDALMAGKRDLFETYNTKFGVRAFFWSTSRSERSLYSGYSTVWRYGGDGWYGFRGYSVRCLKN